jgi:hypothetical protein
MAQQAQVIPLTFDALFRRGGSGLTARVIPFGERGLHLVISTLGTIEPNVFNGRRVLLCYEVRGTRYAAAGKVIVPKGTEQIGLAYTLIIELDRPNQFDALGFNDRWSFISELRFPVGPRIYRLENLYFAGSREA